MIKQKLQEGYTISDSGYLIDPPTSTPTPTPKPTLTPTSIPTPTPTIDNIEIPNDSIIPDETTEELKDSNT